MILLRIYLEFARAGLFAVGGGLATIPFLQDMGERTGWFTDRMLTTMIAVSESTPGPIGVNMATYVGYTRAGVVGAVIATLGLLTPSLVIILLIARVLEKFRSSRTVESVFYGLRPASTALIASAGITVASKVLVQQTGGALSLCWPAVLLALTVFLCIRRTPLKKLHPIWFIAASAAAGVVFKL